MEMTGNTHKTVGGGIKMTGLLVASIAFALLVICPLMAGMTNIITSATHLSIIWIAILGTVPAPPLINMMTLIFRKYEFFCGISLLYLDLYHDCGRYKRDQFQCWRGNAYHDVILDSGYKGCLNGLNVGELKCS